MPSNQQLGHTDPDPASTRHLVVLGGGRQGRALAESLVDSVDTVTLVCTDTDPERAPEGVDVLPERVASATDVTAIEDVAGPVDAVVATGTDSEALLAGYLARRELDPDIVIATMTDPARDAAFSATGIERLDVSTVLADHIRSRLEQARR